MAVATVKATVATVAVMAGRGGSTAGVEVRAASRVMGAGPAMAVARGEAGAARAATEVLAAWKGLAWAGEAPAVVLAAGMAVEVADAEEGKVADTRVLVVAAVTAPGLEVARMVAVVAMRAAAVRVEVGVAEAAMALVAQARVAVEVPWVVEA